MIAAGRNRADHWLREMRHASVNLMDLPCEKAGLTRSFDCPAQDAQSPVPARSSTQLHLRQPAVRGSFLPEGRQKYAERQINCIGQPRFDCCTVSQPRTNT
jgi:hypothetical protein